MAHLQPPAPRLRAVFFTANDEHSGRAWMLSLPRAGSGIVSLGNAKHGVMVPFCAGLPHQNWLIFFGQMLVNIPAPWSIYTYIIYIYMSYIYMVDMIKGDITRRFIR